MHLNLLNKLEPISAIEASKRVIVWLIEKLDAAGFSELFEGFYEVWVPALTLFNEYS